MGSCGNVADRTMPLVGYTRVVSMAIQRPELRGMARWVVVAQRFHDYYSLADFNNPIKCTLRYDATTYEN